MAVAAAAGDRPPPQQSGEIRARMELYNRALGVECTHCHVEGAWADDSKPAFGIARRMSEMVPVINGRLDKTDRVGCWTCHRGEVRPSRQPRPLFDAELEKWPAALASAPEGLKVTMSVYNVALGVTCDHCHGPDWKSGDKSAFRMARTMNGLFELFPKYMPPTARTQCYMCHKGSLKPPARP
jgi:hypothetical protein